MCVLVEEFPQFSFFDVFLVLTQEDDKVEFFGVWSTLEEARREANRRYNGFVVRFGLDGGPDDYEYVE